jgi:hypothetical protein
LVSDSTHAGGCCDDAGEIFGSQEMQLNRKSMPAAFTHGGRAALVITPADHPQISSKYGGCDALSGQGRRDLHFCAANKHPDVLT